MFFKDPFRHRAPNKDIPLLPLHASDLSRDSSRYQTAPASPDSKHLSHGKIQSPQPRMTTQLPILQLDSYLALSRQEKHLQQYLQQLLDAQSEGLLAGLTGGSAAQDAASSTGSRTPTTYLDSEYRGDSRPRSIVPVRQPIQKKLGLRGARRGIGSTMTDLAVLKTQEGRLLQQELVQRDGFISTLDGFSQRTEGLREQVASIEAEPASARVEGMRSEEKALGLEVRELENRLLEMKVRQQHLMKDIEEVENGVQAKLSSYQNALVLAEREAKAFLARPPLGSAVGSLSDSAIWALPKERRTLEVARSQFQEEQKSLKEQLGNIEMEKTALEGGGKVWAEVLQEVNGVERLLKAEMQKTHTADRKNGAVDGMNKILDLMRQAKDHIENKLYIAEEKNWKLLVCCIGAELEAMIEGQEVLQGALDTSQGREHETLHQEQSELSNGHSDGGKGKQRESMPHQNTGLTQDEDADDGPGPDLLDSQDD